MEMKKIYVVRSGMQEGCIHHDSVFVVAAHNEEKALEIANIETGENHIRGPHAEEAKDIRHAYRLAVYYSDNIFVRLPIQAKTKFWEFYHGLRS